jgi:tetratricopeptide (TPR) repeat protein
MRTLLRILLIASFPLTVTACIWDAQSLSHEKSRSHDLAQTILHNEPTPENTNELRATIKSLEANRQENDAMWWNNLAGAYIRLGRSETAAKLLEPVVGKFPNDYGIHANLGTAYHLLGRYKDAEKEIARDLEINPHAHFGLEKYHLALLQYLIRDPKYQARHVYVDEYTVFLLSAEGGHFYFASSAEEMAKERAKGKYKNDIAAIEGDYRALLKTNQDDYKAGQMLAMLATLDTPPPYRTNLDLLHDTNFEAGVIYMAQMNPREPACWTMLGMAAWKRMDYHLAVAAFEEAISLGPPQSELLRKRTIEIQEFIRRSREQRILGYALGSLPVFFILLLIYMISSNVIKSRRLSK